MRNPLAVAVARARRGESEGGGAVYQAAAASRLWQDYVFGTLSGNDQIRWSLAPLRNRARELITRNGHASRVPQLYSEKVVGQHGITYSAAVKFGDGTLDAGTNAELEAAFYRWAESLDVTVDRSLCLPELEAADMEAEVTDGESLIRVVENAPNPFGLALEVLDPDQLDHTLNVEAGEGRNAIVMGVEVDGWTRPVAYHLFKNHPSERGHGRHVRVDAAQIWHTYLRRRVRQQRGLSWFAPALLDFSMHGGYRQTQLIAARAASGKMGFLEPGENAEAWGDEEEDLDYEGGRAVLPNEVIPGAIDRLPRGWKFSSHDPAFPSTNFAEFNSALLQTLAVSMRVTYAELSGDLAGTSYGSGRMGLLDVQNVYRCFQIRRVRRFNVPVLAAFVRNALMTGALRLPSFDASRYLAATWHPQPLPWLQPKEDLDVRLAMRRAGLISLTEIAAENGRDIEEVFANIRREEELAREYGVKIDLSPSSQARDPIIGAPAAAPGPASARQAALSLLTGGE